MTYAPRPSEFVACRCEHAAGGRVAANRPGILRRLLEAVFISRQRQAEREVIGYLERTGGRFTDDIERRITDRLVTGQWRR
jgi:hypothetical protein